MAAFPIAKLAYLLVRQIGKPFAARIKVRAKKSHFFRTYVCMPPAQFYHWIEVNIKMRMLNLGKPTDVPKLNEAMAIELGSELLGEGVVFAVAAACLVAEYVRSSNKDKEKEEKKAEEMRDLLERVSELELRLATQEATATELQRMTFGMHTSIRDWWKKNPADGGGAKLERDGKVVGRSTSSPVTVTNGELSAATKTGVLVKAISDVNVTLTGKPS